MRFLRFTHKWLGLIVGVQLILWSVSGLMFAWLDHHAVSGEHRAQPPSAVILDARTPLTEPSAWLPDYHGSNLIGIRLLALANLWVYRIEFADRIELRRAADGRRVAIDEGLVRQLALAHYRGSGTLRRIVVHEQTTLEARRSGPVWQAEFDDPDRSSLYFSAADGRFVAARTDTWRLFDVFWMLHTMDYVGRDNFNHPLVILVSTGALWLGISGMLLLLRAFRPGELNLLARWRARSFASND